MYINVYVHVYMHVYVHVYVHVYIHVYVHMYVHVHMHIQVFLFLYCVLLCRLCYVNGTHVHNIQKGAFMLLHAVCTYHIVHTTVHILLYACRHFNISQHCAYAYMYMW